MYLTNSRVIRTSAHAMTPATDYYGRSDNFAATFSFADGSVANLIYTALGCDSYPKESFEVFVDGKVLVLNNYTSLDVHGTKAKGIRTRLPDKGQKQELIAFADAIQNGGEWPIPLWQQIQATEMAMEVDLQIAGNPIRLEQAVERVPA